jgi:uncharacterized cupin superfamily protein
MDRHLSYVGMTRHREEARLYARNDDFKDFKTLGQPEVRYLIDGTANRGAAGMFELTVPPGARVPPAHRHSKNEEIVYCLEGTLCTSVGDEVRDLKPANGAIRRVA